MRLFHFPARLRWLAACVLVLLAYTAWNIQRPVPVAAAGTISLTTIGATYSQDFNSLSNSSPSSTVPIGWDFVETGGLADGSYAADDGSLPSGDTYSYGSTGASDRAFGTLRQDGFTSSVIGASFTNNTGNTIVGLNIAYTGKQWRLGTTGRVDRLNFEYSLDASSLSTGTWTPVTALNFTAPLTTGLIGAKDGNAGGNRTAIASAISGLSIANGATFWIRWTDFDATGAEDGLAVDDFSLTPSTCTQTVTNGNDSGPGSLRDAIANVCTGGLITFQAGVTTVNLTSTQLFINKTLTIDGGVSGVTVTRMVGSPNFRIFLVNSGTAAVLRNLTVSNGNLSSGTGGGFLVGGTLMLTNCTISNNSAPFGNGGGLNCNSSSMVTLTNCTISNNSASGGSGGGLNCNSGSTATLTNCTVSNNSASSGTGGGLYCNSGSTVTLTNCTVSNNSASPGGGGGLNNIGTPTLNNTIVAQNTASNNSNIQGTVGGTSSFNLIGVGGTGGLTNGVNGNQVGVAAPGLGTLGLNGGATPTVPLLAGSPAIDAGTATGAPATDQRGFGRAGATDIGAFEFNGSDPGTTVISINRNGAAILCGGTSVSWTVTFAAPVTGVASSNFALANSGLTGPAITGVTGSGNQWTVMANVGTGPGNLGLNMVNSSGVVPIVSNLPFTGQVFSVGSSLTVTAGSNSPLVAGATLNLTATPGGAGTFTFAWTGPGGFTSSQQNPSLSNVTAANSGTYTVTMTETGSGCTGMASTQVALELSGSVGLGVGSTNYTGGTPPVNPANPSYGTFLINTTLTNTSGGTLQAPLFFRVTILEKVPVVPSDPMPYWLDSRDAGSPPDVGAVQTVAAPLANNASTPVTFRVAVAQSNRATFRLFVDFFGATNTSPVVRKIGGFELTPQFPVQNLSSENSQPSILSPQFGDDTQSSVLSPQSSLIGGAGLQSGSTVAVDPKEPRRMAVAANNYELGTVAVRYTEDGGASWREYRASRTLGSSTYATAFDPALGYDRNGSLFVTYALANVTDNSSAVAIASKGLDRLTFSPAVALASYSHAEQTLPSRTALAIEGSKIVAVWESLSGGSQTSRIHAMTLAPRRSVVVAEGGVSQPTVTVTPEGRIVVGWNDWANRQLKVATSLDNSTYSDPVTVAETGIGYGHRIPALADVLALSGFSIKADPTGNGRLYACFTSLGNGLDVFLSRSSDNGKTWDSPALVNDDKSDANQFNPALAVDASGNVAISFCDTRLDGTGSTTHVFLARSRNSGVSFEPNEQVTTEASNTSASRITRIRGANLGERMGIAPAAKSGWILVWTDTRLGSEDIFLTTK
ncbi:MAG: right-handed parallel beta-helix repeat-containing protein [Blastocatellia bacterium]|nr:right-handed parallel beta-helix repeat-containing protein [Blastocatellia bacterium]